ncbi:MAG: 16S rRNA (cytidine(1402)-2'-O)-methyltransferase [bacterium]|nr:16S rRNA (cytidine(1402)-2'-O)-methyltransferase [bacterium]MCP4799888.1 16S rRNA (cytidine(1402)-2'-O)-methyltransferase [bacterium]
MITLPEIDFPEGSCMLVATPIGNMSDMSFRGLAALVAADVVYAEDTRRTRRLLAHYGISARLEPLHDHNKEKVVPKAISRVSDGQKIVLVSDAGMPAIADPGFVLVRELRNANLPYSIVPGPSSVLAALVLSGFPTDKFYFAGYLPRKSGKLLKTLEGLLSGKETVVALESCHRIMKSLAAIKELAPERELAIAREITKVHEETLHGTAGQLIEMMTGPRLKGELVLLIHGTG